MSWEVRQGHVLTRLREMPAESVQCVVTSPPYFGLRDYGTAQWDGGSEGCDHTEREIRTGLGLAEWSAVNAAGGGHKAGQVDKIAYRDVCGKCGARRVDEQIGLEATPDEYVAKLVAVFREVRRVLRDDGTVWLNLGDSYNNRSVARPSSHQGGLGFENESIARSWAEQTKLGLSRLSFSHDGLKEKDLIGIPWMLAFALRADGWYLRMDIIWGKPNPMPESVTDRPTKAHEYVFLLSKSSRYFYDADAIRERAAEASGPRHQRGRSEGNKLVNGAPGQTPHSKNAPRDLDRTREMPTTANRKSVWSVATQPYADAHFAVFPPKLVEPCVLAGSSPRACAVCGAPWERVSEHVPSGWDGSTYGERAVQAAGGALSGGTDRSTLGSSNGKLTAERRTVGWAPSCVCHRRECVARSVVLDPFAGSGTVGVVCEWYGRDFIGIELSSEYAELARRRIAAEGPLGRAASRPRVRDEQPSLFEEV